jgi:hypothetical protein
MSRGKVTADSRQWNDDDHERDQMARKGFTQRASGAEAARPPAAYRFHTAVGRPPNCGPQPVVPGR